MRDIFLSNEMFNLTTLYKLSIEMNTLYQKVNFLDFDDKV